MKNENNEMNNLYEEGALKIQKLTFAEVVFAVVAVLPIMIPMGTFIVAPANEIEQVATITWGKAIGQWAFFTANIFALMAMFTSFCPITQTLISNIVDFFKLKSDTDIKIRLPIMVVVLGIPFFLTVTGMVSFIDAVYFSGTFAAAIMAILPIFMVNNARKYGEIEPVWNCGKLASPIIQLIIIVLWWRNYYICNIRYRGYFTSGLVN